MDKPLLCHFSERHTSYRHKNYHLFQAIKLDGTARTNSLRWSALSWALGVVIQVSKNITGKVCVHLKNASLLMLHVSIRAKTTTSLLTRDVKICCKPFTCQNAISKINTWGINFPQGIHVSLSDGIYLPEQPRKMYWWIQGMSNISFGFSKL